MIPRKSGDRQKNDKRDAASPAVLHRGGLLTAVWVPDAAHEAMRDLIRARLAAVRAVRAARQQLSAFLLRHERIFPNDGHPWTRAHRRWLADQRFDQPARQIVLEEGIEAVRRGEQRLDRVDGHLRVADTGMVAVPPGEEPVRPAWPGHDRQRWPGGSDWRPVAFRDGVRLHGLSRPGAIRAFLRPEAPPPSGQAQGQAPPSPRPATFTPAPC